MRRSKGEIVLTRADKAAYDARRAGPSTYLQSEIVRSTRDLTTSLSEIAQKAGVSDSTLSSWRRGLRVPTPEALEVLADVIEERGRMIQFHGEVLRGHANRLRTPAGRAYMLLNRRLRFDLERYLLERPFELALEERLSERPGADPLREAEELAREMVSAESNSLAAPR